MLIVSLVVLIPRIGIISLVTMMRFLLAGIMFGHFSLPSFLMYVTISGFLYTAMAAPLGVMLGNKLKKTASQMH